MLLRITIAALFSIFASSATSTTLVSFDASGSNNTDDAGFFGVSVSSTNGRSVTSATFDLRPFSGAFFDFDGDSNFGGSTAPVFSSLVGITTSDITLAFVGAASTPTALTLNFAAGTFSHGDSLRFGADTDSFLGGPPDAGGEFGAANVLASARVNGVTLSTPFVRQSSTVSTADLEFGTTVIPLPDGLPLLLSAFAILGMIQLRRTKTISVMHS